MKTVLCGPPHSGKSCLREGLKQAIRCLPNAPYPYVITACPDGEGAWFSETVRRSREEAIRLKHNHKGNFSWEFAKVRSQWVRNATTPLTLVDVGGKIDDKNRLIMQPATHAVILAGDLACVGEWEAFCNELALQVIAILHSDYAGTCDRIDAEVPILRGSVHYLEHGEELWNRPTIQKLARILVDLSKVA
jgi:CRISPR-associated protein Csx3